MQQDKRSHNLLIATYLEPEHVARIRAVDPRLNVVYVPELIPQPRYAADHVGAPLVRTPDEEARSASVAWAGRNPIRF